MASFQDIIRNSGKGLDSSKDLIYLLDIVIGGTLGDLESGTISFANIGRDVEGVFYKSKLQNTGNITRAVQPENGQFETSDLSISLANGDLEFSRWPWNYSILNKPSVLKMGFSGSNVIEYLADCTYMADCSILANGGPMGAGSPGDISVGVAYTLYKGIIKEEERSNKEFRLSIGDYTNKIFRTIPPRVIKVDEFPNIGTSVTVEGTKTDFETDLIGKPIPYIYGDFTDAPLIHPLFIDTVQNRYLIADHAIGTVIKVISGGTQVFNFTHPNTNGLVGGTHISGTNIISFIDFGTSQGTKNVYVEMKGRYDSYGTLLQNSALILKDILLSTGICQLSSNDIGTATFDVAEAFLNPYSFRYIMNGEIHKNTIDLIQDLGITSMSNFYFDKENQANFSVYRPAVSRGNIRKIQQHEILEDSFSITRDVRDVWNRVVVNYDYDWIKDEYRNVYETSGTNFVDQFDTVRTFTIDNPFVYSSIEASYAGRRWLSKLQGGLNKVNFSVPLSLLPMDIGERVQVSHDEPPTASGGWTDRLINITEFEIDNKGKQINITAIDEQEVALSQRYFILGNGTAFYRSASESQRYYGALSSAGGTMSNSDSGYRLWAWFLPLFFCIGSIIC